MKTREQELTLVSEFYNALTWRNWKEMMTVQSNPIYQPKRKKLKGYQKQKSSFNKRR
jgi:hypothetical protein